MTFLQTLFRRRRSSWSRVTGPRRALYVLSGLFIGAVLFMRLDQSGMSDMNLKRTQVTIAQSTIVVELAIEPKEQASGLSGRPSLSAGYGMLFVFSEPQRYGFWMKGMNFPIDIIWIKDGLIDKVSSRVPMTLPGMKPAQVWPDRPVDMVLEVPAGYAASQGWWPGLKVKVKEWQEESYDYFE